MEGDHPDTRKYVIPTKQIRNQDDMIRWEKSEAYQEYLGFIHLVGEAISGKKIRDEKISKSDNVNKLLNILDQLSKWIEEIQPLEQQQRFGNKAFRDWYDRLKKVRKKLPNDKIPCKVNIFFFFLEFIRFFETFIF